MRVFLLIFILFQSLALGAQTDLNVYSERTDKSVLFYADNNNPFPQSVKLTLKLKGIRPKKELPDFILVPADSSKFLLAELINPINKPWSYSFEYSYVMGDVKAKHNDSYLYLLPYREGKSFKVVQGYHGRLSHANENALDFDLPAGEPITAARGGKVVKLKEDSNQGCPNKSCANMGNYVTIMHDDGTFADYYHLQQNGVLVEIGDKITPGQEIGLTGNTGWATGYHLHFLVYRQKLTGRETLSTQFSTKRGTFTLVEGKYYKSGQK